MCFYITATLPKNTILEDFRNLFNNTDYMLAINMLIEEYNKFNTSHNKAQKERQKYTSMGYTLIGHDAEFLRLIKTKEGYVAPFPRWQACGPNHSQRKLIIVKGHPRTYKKGLQLVQ